MIGSINGYVSAAGIDWLLVETTGGVGYRVSTPTSIATQHPVGSPVTLVTHLVVREDQLTLYGFKTPAELAFFEQLVGVSGVGPRLGLAVLNAGDVKSLKTAIAKNDVAVLTTISGIGRKTAERIVVELKNQLTDFTDGAITPHASEDLLVALSQLGYNTHEIRDVVLRIPSNITDTEEQVRHALKLLANK